MKHKLIPAVIVALIFSIVEISIEVTEVLFGIGLSIGIAAVVIDYLFFNIIGSSGRTKAVHLFRKFKGDLKAQYLRSSLRSTVLLSIPTIYIGVSILYLYAFLAYILTGLVYFSYLGHTFSEDLSDPNDFIDEE